MTRRGLLAALLGSVCASALPLADAGAVQSPNFEKMYSKYPILRPDAPKWRNTPPLTEEAVRELNVLMDHIKRTVRFRYDPPGPDDWDIAWSSGDCDGFAWRFTHDLLAAGWRREMLSVVYCRTEQRQAHMCLMVGEGPEALILDQRWDFALPPQRLRDFGYEFIAAEDHTGGWESFT